MVSAVVGFLVWVVANVVYADKRRRAVRGFARFLAFWLGFPGTLVSLLFVEEGSQPSLNPPPDDEESLLAEVRRERARRIEAPVEDTRAGDTEEAS